MKQSMQQALLTRRTYGRWVIMEVMQYTTSSIQLCNHEPSNTTPLLTQKRSHAAVVSTSLLLRALPTSQTTSKRRLLRNHHHTSNTNNTTMQTHHTTSENFTETQSKSQGTLTPFKRKEEMASEWRATSTHHSRDRKERYGGKNNVVDDNCYLQSDELQGRRNHNQNVTVHMNVNRNANFMNDENEEVDDFDHVAGLEDLDDSHDSYSITNNNNNYNYHQGIKSHKDSLFSDDDDIDDVDHISLSSLHEGNEKDNDVFSKGYKCAMSSLYKEEENEEHLERPPPSPLPVQKEKRADNKEVRSVDKICINTEEKEDDVNLVQLDNYDNDCSRFVLIDSNNEDSSILTINNKKCSNEEVQLNYKLAKRKFEHLLQSMEHEQIHHGHDHSRNQSPLSLTEEHIKSTKCVRVSLPFYVYGNVKVCAMGQSTRAKQARALCYIHGCRLIEYYRKNHNREGKSEDAPLPLTDWEPTNIKQLENNAEEEEETSSDSLFTPPAESENAENNQVNDYNNNVNSHNNNMKAVNVSSTRRPSGFAIVPEPRHKRKSGRHNKKHNDNTSEENDEDNTKNKFIAPSHLHPVVEKARQELCRRREQQQQLSSGSTKAMEADVNVLQELNKKMKRVVQSITLSYEKRSGNHVATLVLDKEQGIEACGVARRSKAARRECAAHALCILELLHQEQGQENGIININVNVNNSNSNHNITSSEMNTGMANSESSSAPLQTLLATLAPHYMKLYNMFSFLFMKEPYKVQFSRIGKTNVNKSQYMNFNGGGANTEEFICKLTLSNITCEGKGINRFEAERQALQSVLEEMEKYDERMQCLNKFIAQNPEVSPETIPTMALPCELQQRINATLNEIQCTFPADQMELHNNSVDNSSNGNDNCSITPPSVELLRSMQPSNAIYAQQMKERLIALHNHEYYKTHYKMRRSSLPMASACTEVLRSLESHRVIVICGTTGCGKSTQVPQYILDDAIMHDKGDHCHIIVTQPRRLSTFGVAERIAHERMSRLGDEVGYAVRLESRPGKHLNICTSGVLLQMMCSDPFLSELTHLIIDEVHERDINCDTLLALVKQIMQHNQHLKVILMSATLQPELFKSYFNGAPVIQVDGTVYPIKEYFLEDIVQTITQEQEEQQKHYNNNNAIIPTFQSPMFALVEEERQQQSQRVPRYGRLSYLARRSRQPRSLLFPPKTDYNLIAYLVYRCARDILQSAASTTENTVENDCITNNVDEEAIEEEELELAKEKEEEEKDYVNKSKLKTTNLLTPNNAQENGSRSSKDKKPLKSILVFLPGWKELVAARNAVEAFATTPYAQVQISKNNNNNNNNNNEEGENEEYVVPQFHIILLHSTVDSAKQRECFAPPPPNKIKLILATNIAESGVTIDDAGVIIDTGLIKQTTWTRRDGNGNANENSFMSSLPRRHRRSFLDDRSFSGMNGYLGSSELPSLLSSSDNTTGGNNNTSFATQLSLSYASRANCTQRKGRAGRTQGGICYRLFTRTTYDALPSFPVAEIHRVSLTQVLLKLLFLGYQAPKLTLQSFIEPPSSVNVEASMVQLQDLGAVTREEQLTPLGKYLSQLPCDPRVGKMIMMGAVLNCLDSVLTLAATVDAKPYISNREESMLIRTKKYLFARGAESDQISLLNAFNAFCAMHENREFATFNALHIGNLYTISKYKMQYRDILLTSGFFTYDELQPLESDIEKTENSKESNGNCRYKSEAGNGIQPVSPPRYVSQLCIDRSKLSRDALDVALVKACVCCSLFPNLAMLDVSNIVQKGKMIKKLSLKTKTHKSITPAKESVCRRAGGPMSSTIPEKDEYMKQFKRVNRNNNNNKDKDANGNDIANFSKPVLPAMFYVYQDIFSVLESRRDFLTNVSAVSLWAILLFGASETKMEYFAPLGLCVIDGWIPVRIAPETYFTLNNLRQCLNNCIWRKYQQPANSDNNSAIDKLRVLSKEVLKLPLCNNNSDNNESLSYRNITDNWQRLVDGGVITSPTVQEDERMLNQQTIKDNDSSNKEESCSTSTTSSEKIANNIDSNRLKSDREFLLYATRITPVEEDEIDAWNES